MDDVFVVEVDVTDRTVEDGAFVVDTYGFVLLAPNHHEARLTAFQWTIWKVDELCTGENMIVATRIID
jgi:hypothetical protein